jgi:hypothetical protein
MNVNKRRRRRFIFQIRGRAGSAAVRSESNGFICCEMWEWCGCSAARGETDAVTMGFSFLHSFCFSYWCLILELVWLLKDWFFILIINLLIQIENWNFLKDLQSLKLDLTQGLGCVNDWMLCRRRWKVKLWGIKRINNRVGRSTWWYF